MNSALRQVIGGFQPAAIADALIEGWDAERPSLITRVSGLVSSWAGQKRGYAIAQATEAARPAYSVYNGRPIVQFDGVDDELTLLGTGILPVGAAPCEIWALCTQEALAADTNVRVLFGYGTANGTARRVGRLVSTTNRMVTYVGDGTNPITVASPSTDLSGLVIMRARIGAAATINEANRRTAQTSVVPNTGTGRMRMGAGASSTPLGFWQGGVNWLGVTKPLSSIQADRMYNWLDARRA